MRILSVNVAQKQRLRINGREANTGIFKQAVHGPVQVSRAGLAGDTVNNKKHHGGPDQAVYVYTKADYDWWEEELGRDLTPGTFGENLTIVGLEQAARLRIGDRFSVGDLVLEATAPRIPCMTLESRMAIRGFAMQFRDAERPGFYCRVIAEGKVSAGDAVDFIPAAVPTVSLIEVFRDFYTPIMEEEAIRRILAAPIAVRARAHKVRQLENLLGNPPS